MQIRPASPTARWSLVALKSVSAMAPKQSELLVLELRGDFQLLWRLWCTGAVLFGRW